MGGRGISGRRARISVSRRAACAVAAAIALTNAAACVDYDCIPTTTVAADASLVVAPTVARSGVLNATLTAEGKALSGQKITFSVEDALVGDPTLGSDTTDARGRARLDLKERPLRIHKTVTQDEYIAAYAGDGTYCASSDTAVLDIARVQ